MPFAILPVLSGLWGNPLARTAILVAGAFLFGFWKGFESVPRPDIPAIVRNAEAGRDAAWQAKLAEQERQSQAELDAAIEARDHAADPVDATVASLCQHDRDCTDHSN